MTRQLLLFGNGADQKPVSHLTLAPLARQSIENVMTYLESGEIALILIIGLLIFVLFFYLVSLIAKLPPLRKAAQQSRFIRKIIALGLGLLVCISMFLFATRWTAETDYYLPPHGVAFGEWDDFQNNKSGALFIEEATDEVVRVNDTVLNQITHERFRRYLLPPSFRSYCFTGDSISCKWSDIDLLHFDDKKEWSDFLIRVFLGILSGFLTGFMTWMHTTENRDNLQPSISG